MKKHLFLTALVACTTGASGLAYWALSPVEREIVSIAARGGGGRLLDQAQERR